MLLCMNVTELARVLKINPQDLRDFLPQLGFHIGQKAIKIDNRTAQKIIKGWPTFLKQLKKIEEENLEETEEEKDKIKKIISVPDFITVKNLALLFEMPINKILSELMENGVFSSINERIDFETAAIVGSNLGFEVKLDKKQLQTDKVNENKISEILKKEKKENLQQRPPVVVVMGHVDHGKTKLLDAIRRTNVVDEEAGGITQHIGAYQVKRRNRLITFIDTPGHEAFAAMRSRGAKVADIAILVVAADDGVKQQTTEAFRIIETAKIPFLVAINKIDKNEADINKTKQELSSKLNIIPEDWGGKVVCSPVSAKAGTGIEDLLDIVLLIADLEKENISANPKSEAAGTVVESHIDKGAGPIATILSQNGTLKIGDQLCFEGKNYGKVRALRNYKGEEIKEALPSTPVIIIGFKILPQVGDILKVGEGEKIKISRYRHGYNGHEKIKSTSNKQDTDEKNDKIKKINIIIKSDVLGSAEAIEESLEKINNEKIRVDIINKGLGNITEGDIEKAEAADAQILGFNIKIKPQIENLIREKNIKVNIFNIIYDLIKYITEEMQQLIEPDIKRLYTGKLKVMAIFRTENNSQIIGGKIIDGKIEINNFIEVIRDKEIIEKGKLIKLQSGKQDVNFIDENMECGLQYEGKPIIEEGDILQFYKEEKTIEKI